MIYNTGSCLVQVQPRKQLFVVSETPVRIPPFPRSFPRVPCPAPHQLTLTACVQKRLLYNTRADVKRI
jgi:hypothetical protein